MMLILMVMLLPILNYDAVGYIITDAVGYTITDAVAQCS